MMRIAALLSLVAGHVRGSQPAPLPPQTFFPFGLPAGRTSDETQRIVSDGETVAHETRAARSELRSLKARGDKLAREGVGIEATYQAMNATLSTWYCPKSTQ